jgi:hypothetical protein
MEQEIVVASDVTTRFRMDEGQETEDLAIKVPEGVPQISGGTSEQLYLSWFAPPLWISKPAEKYEELVHYFKYASSCYVLLCPRPCGNTLITTVCLTRTFARLHLTFMAIDGSGFSSPTQ